MSFYNSVPCNDDEMYTIKSIIDTKVNACNTVYKKTVSDVTQMKTAKSDGRAGLKSDHFLNGTN